MAAEMISTIVLFNFDIRSGKRRLLLSSPRQGIVPLGYGVAVVAHQLWHEVQVPPTHLSNTTPPSLLTRLAPHLLTLR